MPASSQNLLSQAKLLLDQAKKSSHYELISLATQLAKLTLEIGQKQASFKERFISRMMGAMMDDPIGKYFITCLMDRFFRSQRFRTQWRQFDEIKTRIGIAPFLPTLFQFALEILEKLARYVPALSTQALQKAIRWQTQEVIVDAKASSLKQHLKKRRKENIRINLNHLGEAILGEKEASNRLATYLHDLKNPLVEYISVKISTLYSQINPLAREKTLCILKERLSNLYTCALENNYTSPSGHKHTKLVNLDMEEYADLDLTIELFKQTLSEPSFLHSRTGIVLQSYLPDSWPKLLELIEFSKKRVQSGGTPIKIRLVKGANLAMEQLQARVRGWNQTPYREKSLVDANFKRLLHCASEACQRGELILGVGSHNLFDICYVMLLRENLEITESVELEMLEGMAPQIRRAVHSLSKDMLLYCPAATPEEFSSAIAYLVRRLDENTGPDNFLRHFFHLDHHPEIFETQAKLFENSFSLIPSLTLDSFRQPRSLSAQVKDQDSLEKALSKPFINEPDTDWSSPQTCLEMRQILDERAQAPPFSLPCVIEGKEWFSEQNQEMKKEIFEDPSRPGVIAFEVSLAPWPLVNQAIETAHKAYKEWSLKTPRERSCAIYPLAHLLREHRGELIALMASTCAKRVEEADGEVSEAIDFVEYYCRQAIEFEEIKGLNLNSRGVAFVAPPWNFPLAIGLGGVLGALLTGHPVLFKPAPIAYAVGYRLSQLLWQVGISKELVQFIALDEESVGKKLLQDSRIAIAVLTGSTETAKLFLESAPTRPLIAETGGKNTIILSDTCDRDLAIKDLVQSAFSHSGQKCSAASLALIHDELYKDPKFWAQLLDATTSLSVGGCFDPENKVTPLLMADDPKLKWALSKLEEGQEWVLKPTQSPQNAKLWSPGIVKGVRKGQRRHMEEFFGPILGVMPYRQLEEAIEIANQTPYGLTAGLYTLNESEESLWTKQILAGNLYVNRPTTGAIVLRQPFGGTKASRIGQGRKAGGPQYLLSFYTPDPSSMPQGEQIRYPEKLTQILSSTPDEMKQELEPIFKSYSYWYLHFTREIDSVRIPGQNNLYVLKSQEDYLLRWEGEMGSEKEFWCALAAAVLCQNKVRVSATHWPSKIAPASFIEFFQENENWVNLWEKRPLQTVRVVGKLEHTTLQSLAARNLNTLLDPVCFHGRYEVLHPLREVSFCRDYHRYGNLGLQSNQNFHSRVLF